MLEMTEVGSETEEYPESNMTGRVVSLKTVVFSFPENVMEDNWAQYLRRGGIN
jgi:hypothetical protein